MAAEALTLDGLALNDGTSFALLDGGVSVPPPRQRQEWIGAADSEWETLVRNPLHENRKVTLQVAVIQQATMDLALAKVASVVDKLQKASKTPDGIGLTWTPNGGTITVTFDVLAGEITDLPIDWASLWMSQAPTLTIELTCKPYWRGTETLTATATATAPVTTLEVPNVTGDVPALGRLIVTDTATQSRRFVEWGLEGPLTYNSGTTLILDSDSLVVTGFSGTQTTVATNTYDPNAVGTNAIIGGAFLQTAALCGTGNQTHVGSFSVRGRIMSALAGTSMFRLAWQVDDGPFTANPWVIPDVAFDWVERPMGTITIPAGSARWTGRVEVALNPANLGPLGTGVYVDYLTLVPTSDGYGKARASYSYSPGAITGYDSFVGTTAAAALNARAAPVGGSWATSGDATDLAFADTFGSATGESIKRSTSGPETTGRYAVLGTTNFTDTEISVRAQTRDFSFGTPVTEQAEQTVIARWTDASNHLRFVVPDGGGSSPSSIRLETVVAGVVATVATLPTSTFKRTLAVPYRLRLLVFASGRAIGIVMSDSGAELARVDGSSTVLATAGTLATGKPVLRDRALVATSDPRYFTDFSVSTPAAEPIALYSGRTMEITHEKTVRYDSTGVYPGRPASYNGSRFLVPPGTSRVAVLARRNDIEAANSTNVTDSTRIQVGTTPRGVAVPR